MPNRYRVGVVGFGIAGGTVSYLLARAGHEVSLFERAPVLGPVGAGILLQPSGQIVLGKLGLLDQVTQLGEPIEELAAFTHRGRTLMHLPYGEIATGCRAYGVHRGDLFDVLHKAVRAQPVRILAGHEMHGSHVRDRRIYLEDGDKQEHGPFDFVLVTDGSNSRLRGATKLRKWVHEYAYGAIWTFGRCSAIRSKLHQVTLGTKQLLGLLPIGGGRCNLFWSVRRDEKESVWHAGFDRWKTQVLQLCPLAEELFETVTSFEQVAYTTYRHAWMQRWHDGRVLFLGDAAHAMSPHLGQGVNLALLDAYCFANALARSATPGEAFRRYERTRLRHIRFYALVTLLLTPFFQSSGFIKGWGRDLVLPLLPRIPWLRTQMLLTMAGLKSDFFGGTIDP